VSSPIIYVSENTQNSGVIEAFAVNMNSGVLAPVSGSPFSTNYSTGGDMAVSPNGAFAYVLAVKYPAGTCCVGPTSLLVYALDPTSGAPALKQALATTGIPSASAISVHPSGQFIYLTPYSDNSGNTGIGVFSVQSDGTVVFSGFTQVQTLGGVAISPNGFLYTDSGGVAVGNWPNSQSCGPVNENLSAFSINSTTGALTAVAGSPFIFQRQACDVGHAPQWLTEQIDPAGERLFVVDASDAAVDVFAIDPSSGALAQLPGTSTDSALTGGFYSSAIDPLGRFLYVGSEISSFTGFSLTANTASGTLPVLPGMPVQATPAPFNEASRTMAIDPSGSFLFSNENGFTSAFSCCGPDALVEFQIDATTGALTQVPSPPVTLAGTASRIVVAAPPQ
jgi:6-phosphogluconolactonase (cycloisomerase 2 family)